MIVYLLLLLSFMPYNQQSYPKFVIQIIRGCSLTHSKVVHSQKNDQSGKEPTGHAELIETPLSYSPIHQFEKF